MGDAGASGNFGFLERHDAQLSRLGALAEGVFAEDPNTCLLKLRQFGEHLAQISCARVGLLSENSENQIDRLRRLVDRDALPREAADLFRQVREAVDAANHDLFGNLGTALSCLQVARIPRGWYVRGFGGQRGTAPVPFVPPADPCDATRVFQAEPARLRADEDSQRVRGKG